MCSFILLTFTLVVAANADLQIRNDVQALAEQIEILKRLHLTDVTKLKREIHDLKVKTSNRSTNSHDRNEQVTLQWAKASMKELRTEMRELSESVNNSVLLQQLHTIRNELKQALTETSDLAQMALTQEARVDKLDSEVGRIKYEEQQMRANLAELRTQVGKLSKELKHAQLEQLNSEAYNEVIEAEDGARMIQMKPRHAHKLRHSKMVHEQISRLARSQDQLDLYQQNLQTQLLDVQRRMDRIGDNNWDLISAKVDFIELETKVIRNELKNITQEVSDFNKIHGSLLELREDLENVENKADKTIPEFRKEISKLDVSFAQVNAQASYLKEDQENLRQSVKAIAVSVSNAIDRAELDRLALSRLNESISNLHSASKQHFYRLSDHILKSESSTPDANISQIISLPELMGEVKELQPVEREYEDLVHQLPKDCSNVTGEPGIYLIRPGQLPIDAWCNNGSTLLQRRYNGSIDFNLKISEYIKGFGDPASNYWLGLENMHLMTADNCTMMRIDMTDIYGGKWYAQYDQFYVGSVDTGYVLNVGGFKGNASDAFEFQNHMAFSASDVDRDNSNSDCAANYEGGWWYSHCQHVNINGKYSLGLSWFDSQRNEWIAVSTSEMILRRRTECSAGKY